MSISQNIHTALVNECGATFEVDDDVVKAIIAAGFEELELRNAEKLQIITKISDRIKADSSSPLLTQFAVFAGNAEIAEKRIAEIEHERDDVARAVELAPGSGGINNIFGYLHNTVECADYPERNTVSANENMFPEGLR
ncbi:hypothetical protein ANRL3_02838 [Anaerolineae bacterium]|nr:hypothetical protein ANRL3_02838 [Anaerolineae bacterium]